jgi:hypothetical protein
MIENKVIRQCRYLFSDLERLEFSRQLAEANKRLDTIQDEKKKFASQIKSRIDTTNAEIRVLSDNLHSGYDMRALECYWLLNTPEPGVKSLLRSDTNEIVEKVGMSETEKTGDLFAQPARDVEASVVGKEGESEEE